MIREVVEAALVRLKADPPKDGYYGSSQYDRDVATVVRALEEQIK